MRADFIEKKVGNRNVATTIPTQYKLCPKKKQNELWINTRRQLVFCENFDKCLKLPSTSVSSSDDSIECGNAGENHREIKKNNKNLWMRELCSIFFPFVTPIMTFLI